MENLQIDAGRARETLGELQRQIEEQRRALRHNDGNAREMAERLAYWEKLIQRLQAELDLEKSAQLSQLYELTQTLNANLDWRQTIQAVMDAVIQITGAERGIILAVEEDGELRTEMTSNAAGERFTEDELKFSRSIVRRALDEGISILTTNAQVDPRFRESESIIAYGLRSILCTPLLHHGEAVGVIYLDNRAHVGVFDQEDLAMLAAFARQAAVAVANARQHRKTDRALSTKIRELTILQEMTRDLNLGLNFERVLERSVAWAVAAAGAEAGAVGLVAEEGLRWSARVGNLHPVDVVAIRAVRSHRPILEERRMIFPLLREGRSIGVLYLLTDKRPFSEGKHELLARIADNVAIAIENARLYAALSEANTAKSEFVSLVSHELRTPMTSIQGYADMLSREMVGELSNEQMEFVEAILRNVKRMRLLVSDLLDISQIETGQLKLSLRPTRLEKALEDARQMVAEMMEEKQQIYITDVWEHLPQAYADPDRLTQIFINLLSNASKYTPYRGTIAVRAWMSSQEPNFIRCAITDSGIGIKPEDQVRLFTKFFRADHPAVIEQPGTGLGLAITRNLVEMQGGRIWVESEPEKGSTFFFTVPITVPEVGTL